MTFWEVVKLVFWITVTIIGSTLVAILVGMPKEG
jgi:hypothetical protein